MNELRIGLIGTGSIADDQHAPALNRSEGVKFWSVLSRSDARGASFAMKHRAAAPIASYTDLDQFLADPKLDAVIIATPDRLHARQAILCAEAGKHVLLEKPMATTVDEAEQVDRAFRERGLVLAIGFHLRCHSGHRELRKLIGNGYFGAIRHLRLHWTFKAASGDNWRARKEFGRWWSLAATGSHCLDLIRWLSEPAGLSVDAMESLITHEVWESEHDESTQVSIRLSNGATAASYTSVLFNSPTRLEIYGENGFAICEDTLGRKGGGSIRIGGSVLNFEPVNPFEAQLREFTNAIRGNPHNIATGTSGIQSVKDLLSLGLP